jgi:hypothetical protein
MRIVAARQLAKKGLPLNILNITMEDYPQRQPLATMIPLDGPPGVNQSEYYCVIIRYAFNDRRARTAAD